MRRLLGLVLCIVALVFGVAVGLTTSTASAAGSGPTVTSVSPSRGANANRPLVAISGSGFAAGAAVTFGGVAATQVSVQSSKLIYARPPSHPALGSVDVRVRTKARRSATSAADRYTTTVAPGAPATVTALGLGGPTAMSCPTADFCMVISDKDRAVTTDGTDHGPLLDVPLDGRPLGLSCTSATFCAAISDDQATTFDGSGWSTPVTLTDLAGRSPGLSCSGPLFCAVVGGSGSWWRYNGSGWASATDGPDVGIADTTLGQSWSVSCVSITFCMAQGEVPGPFNDAGGNTIYGGMFRFTGTTWASSYQFDAYSEATSEYGSAVSCSGADYCMAVVFGGQYDYDGTMWAPGIHKVLLDGGFLDCVSAHHCLATGQAYPSRPPLERWDGTTWTVLARPPATATHGDVFACSGFDACTAVTILGFQRRYSDPDSDAGAWGPAHPLGNWLGNTTTVSCVAGPFCVLANGVGNAATWDGHVWSAPVVADTSGHPTSVSCATSTFCILADDFGNVTTYNGATWAAPRHIDNRAINQISCAAEEFCVAVDDGGNVMRLDDGTWHPPAQRNSGPVRGISCTSPTYCMAVGDGNVTRYLGLGRWTATKHIATHTPAVSCTSRTFCAVAVDGGLRFWGGHAFSPTVELHNTDPNRISCADSQFCVSWAPGYAAGSVGQNLWDGAATGALDSYLNDDVLPPGAFSCWAYQQCVFAGTGYTAVQTA